MPNEEGHDPRAIWEKVKDLQIELGNRADEITKLTLRVAELENENEALVLSMTLLEPNKGEG